MVDKKRKEIPYIVSGSREELGPYTKEEDVPQFVSCPFIDTGYSNPDVERPRFVYSGGHSDTVLIPAPASYWDNGVYCVSDPSDFKKVNKLLEERFPRKDVVLEVLASYEHKKVA